MAYILIYTPYNVRCIYNTQPRYNISTSALQARSPRVSCTTGATLNPSRNPTGTMNSATSIMMTMPRCGNVDSAPTRLQRRIRRYVLYGTMWRHMKLTYKITKYSYQISHKDTDASAAKAFKVTFIYTLYIYIYIYLYKNNNIY